MVTPTEQIVAETEGQELDVRASVPASPANNLAGSEPTRCQTTARYESMAENHSGGHSWFFDPLIPLILTVYATVTMILQLILIHNDRSYRHRAPSSYVTTLRIPHSHVLLLSKSR